MFAIPRNSIFLYLVIIGIVDAMVFAYDKHCARKESRRIPERLLHLLELLGGVFLIVPLMYILRHKNRKFKYYAVTYLILLLWVALLYLMNGHSLMQ